MPTPQELLDQIDAASRALRSQLEPAPITTATALQDALNRGGAVNLPAGVTFAGSFVCWEPGTIINGRGSKIVGPKGLPGITVPSNSNAHDITINDLEVSTDDDQRAILVGTNDEKQTSASQAPRRVEFNRVKVKDFRGKRGFEISGADVTLRDCIVLDVWDPTPARRDSQAVWITGNSPGGILVTGGMFSAGSEPILVGGSVAMTPGNVPTGIEISNAMLFRPDEWRTDGVYRKVKNLLEFKTGRKIVARNLGLYGSWKDAQDGYGIVITPHSGGEIHDVLIDGVKMSSVDAGYQLLGQEYAVGSPVTPAPLSGVVIRNTRCTTSPTSALGILAGITGAPVDVLFEDNIAWLSGSRVISYDPGKILNTDGSAAVPSGPMTTFTFHRNKIRGGMKYAFSLGGVHWAGPTPAVQNLSVTENTFADAAAALVKNQPNNVYLSAAAFDAAVQ